MLTIFNLQPLNEIEKPIFLIKITKMKQVISTLTV
jgi:hypothetical protein